MAGARRRWGHRRSRAPLWLRLHSLRPAGAFLLLSLRPAGAYLLNLPPTMSGRTLNRPIARAGGALCPFFLQVTKHDHLTCQHQSALSEDSVCESHAPSLTGTTGTLHDRFQPTSTIPVSKEAFCHSTQSFASFYLHSLRSAGAELLHSLRSAAADLLHSLRPAGAELVHSLRPAGAYLFHSLLRAGADASSC